MKHNVVQNVGEDCASSCPDKIIREHLRKIAELKSIPDIMAGKGLKTTKLMTNLTNVIQVKKRRFEEMNNRYMETKETISNLIAENDKLHQAYSEEMNEMEFSIREHFQWTCNDHETIKLKLDRKEKELQLRSIEVQKREAENENKRRKLAKEMDEISAKKSLLREQRKANKSMMKLADDHKREKETLEKKIIVLEKRLVGKQDLETEIRNLNVNQKIEDRCRNLKEKEEELRNLKSLNQMLAVQNRKSTEELKEARKDLIEGLKELPKAGDIGVKRMGELGIKPFINAVVNRDRYEPIAKNSCSRLHSIWENYLKDPRWQPFKVITINGIPQGFTSENEEELKRLRWHYGEEVYKAVITAWTEINECNFNGFGTTELWNFTESRKATLMEGVSCLLKMWDAEKRARISF